MWIYLLVYVAGALIALGVRGSPRDEMDGIADLFCIFAWPIALVCWLAYRVAAMFVQIGVWIKRST